MKHLSKISFLILYLLVIEKNVAQETNVFIDVNCERFLGDISELDRTKYFSVHDQGMDAEQAKFRQDYNVTGGRGFWGPFSFAKNKTGTVGVYPNPKTDSNSEKAVLENYVATEHPKSAFIDGLDIHKAGEWATEYFNNFANNNGRQEFFEVMNEPFVHSNEFYDGWSTSENQRIKTQMANFYNEVAKKIHAKPQLKNMKVIGYSSAWPSMEINNFGHWEDNLKLFMDIAGDNIYGFSTHLYDGINVTGQDSKRSGSNSEAILDMIETYSMIKWNKVKPHAITEYGAIEKGYGDDYSDLASIQTVASINHILFNLLDRQDRLCNSIPFITGKATWHITKENNYQPYQATLWKPTNIGEPNPAGWEYTPRILFYELWKDVAGKRVMIKSDNPDIQTHAFVKGSKMYLALSNLDDNEQIVNLNMLSKASHLINVKTKDLKIYADKEHEFTISNAKTAPNSLTLIKDETVVLEYEFSENIVFNNSLKSHNYYALNNLEPIVKNQEITYHFSKVTKGDGFATLRMSMGRKHNVSKKPVVKVNDVLIEVPDNYKGYDQANRDDFFGMIEIPFSATLLKENNVVTVTFPDNGGHVSTLILSVELLDKPSKNINLKTLSNQCPNANQGEITISPIVNDDYTVAINGPDYSESFQFNKPLKIQNLKSGSYSISITGTHNKSFNEDYHVVISEPSELKVATKINNHNKKIALQLEGANSYSIKINEKLYNTSQNNLELSLDNGINNIEVNTSKSCQGSFEQSVIIGHKITGFPNPCSDKFTLNLGIDESEMALIKIFNAAGQLKYAENKKKENGNFVVNTSSLATGIHVLKVHTESQSKTVILSKI